MDNISGSGERKNVRHSKAGGVITPPRMFEFWHNVQCNAKLKTLRQVNIPRRALFLASLIIRKSLMKCGRNWR